MQRYAIVGTAGSWKQTPFTDPSVRIASLNDAYRLKGFIRADEWFDFHPLNKFFHTKGQMVYAHQIPPGHYCRPDDHLAWLGQQAQTIPVYLHPDYLTQHPEANDWPNAKPFPKAEVEAHFGRYFTSSPGWMLAKAVMEGYRDIAIYGIHLSTEHEYIEQRPNFEYLIGCVLGPGKKRVSVHDGLRYYESENGRIVLPEASPVLQSDFQYAFEPRPRSFLEPVKWELHKLSLKHQRRVDALKRKPWYHPLVSYQEVDGDGKPLVRKVLASTVQQEILYLEAAILDRQHELRRVELAGA
jgi:hypothetical protein